MFEASRLKEKRDYNTQDGLDVLYYGGAVMMSWGIENITALKASNRCRGMSFRVNGAKFSGTVVLSVNGADLYDVDFYTDGGEVAKQITDVYVMDLIDTIDEFVEKQPEYKF